MEFRPRVVLVEDHALTRAGLRTALESGCDVVGEAADGLAGWETIARERPDVAVIDIGLPAMDGIALTQKVRREFPETRVVIVTMIDLEEEVIAALAAGADAYCLSLGPGAHRRRRAHRARRRRLLRPANRALGAGSLFRNG
jgi:DNA-binding NarL/FixJ family response regulator